VAGRGRPAGGEALRAYLEVGHVAVEGWLSRLAAETIVALAELQAAQGIAGPVAEIGVHHGKLFVLLHLLTSPPERAAAWDLFERQEDNVDRSGGGDEAILRANLTRHGCDPGRIAIHTANSLDLTEAAVIEACGGRPRIFSIDGGHTAEITRSDLLLAARSVCPGGLVVLDDFFNESWPGVAEGTCAAIGGGAVRLFPVVIAGNKVAFTTSPEAADGYRRGLSRPWPGAEAKTSVLFGREVLVLIALPRTVRSRLAGTHLWRAIRSTRLGQAARRLLLPHLVD
jgi:hypothetical protein